MKLSLRNKRSIMVATIVILGILFVYYRPIQESLLNFQTTPIPTVAPDYSNWRTYVNQKYGISLKYPATFQLNSNQTGLLAEWDLYGLPNAKEIFSIEILRSFQARTNFGGATFRLGNSIDPVAIKECLNPPKSLGYKNEYSKREIGGVEFSKFTRTDVGAGNYYEFTSYRALYNNTCEVFEYVIHYGNIDNYPAELKIKEFNKSGIIATLESVLDTVQLIK